MKRLNSIHEKEYNWLPIRVDFFPKEITAIGTIDTKHIDLETQKDNAKKLGVGAKKEFHVTIIWSDTGRQILKSIENLNKTEKDKIIEKIRHLCESTNWKVELEDECYYIEKVYDENKVIDKDKDMPEKRKSIIQMAKIQNLEVFYQQLNELVNKLFKIPMPHITLYTNSTREDKKTRGIGIYSKKLFEELNPQRI